MHDCEQMKDQLVDLVFDEINEIDRASLMKEVLGCQRCRQFHSEMTASLARFDAATETVGPSDAYWSGYEARLQARLLETAPVRWQTRFAQLFPFAIEPRMALAASLLLIVALALGLALFNRGKAITSPSAETATANQPEPDAVTPPEKRAEPPVVTQQDGHKIASAASHQQLPRRRQKTQHRREGEVPPAVADEFNRLARLEQQLVEHLADTELLFRAFRNARPAAGKTEIDIVFEKQLAREIFSRNAILKSETEAIGYQAASEFLSNLDPFLLEIANLADQPAAADLQAIKGLLEDHGIITELQLHSAMALGRGR